MDIELIPAFTDNYFPYFEATRDQWSRTTGDSSSVKVPQALALSRPGLAGRPVVVDPGDAVPVLARLERGPGGNPLILVTHYHPDHVGGCAELRKKTGAEIVGPEGDQERLLDWVVREGDVVDVGSLHFRVMEVPGHTYNHIAYVDEAAGIAFVGDTLFAGGCGRVFSGTAGQLWESLQRLRLLPDGTRIYCAHEYTLGNLEFACHIDPGHEATRQRLSEVHAQRRSGLPTVPTTMGEEKRTNIFLRADEPGMAAKLGLDNETEAEEVFAELRRRKNDW